MFEVLTEGLGSALRPQGTIAAWAGDAGISDITVPWIQFRADGPVYPNPVLPVHPGLSFGDRDVDMLHGLVHGDLHLLNILLPYASDGSLSLARYALIDLATFNESGNVLRDPVCLLLSAVAHTFSSVTPEQEDPLIDLVLGRNAPAHPGPRRGRPGRAGRGLRRGRRTGPGVQRGLAAAVSAVRTDVQLYGGF